MAKRILVIEDDVKILNIVKITLEKEGYEIICKSDGMEGLNSARQESPDLIICDLMLPKMDGYKICRFLKFDQKYKDIPFIILTARTQEEAKKLGLDMGADLFIPKPFSLTDLVEKVGEFLNKGD